MKSRCLLAVSLCVICLLSVCAEPVVRFDMPVLTVNEATGGVCDSLPFSFERTGKNDPLKISYMTYCRIIGRPISALRLS